MFWFSGRAAADILLIISAWLGGRVINDSATPPENHLIFLFYY
jgi:hypothetical protein